MSDTGWTGVPGHPFVAFRAYYDEWGRFWIVCSCAKCGDHWTKQCQRPHLKDRWVFQFATMHGHGLRPRPRYQG